MSFTAQISSQINIPENKVSATLQLLDDHNTVPFIARYRKEVTGNLDEEQIRAIKDLYEKFRTLQERRETILKSIQEQGKLTPELRTKILATTNRSQIEDLYEPYKPKRKTRASEARKNGLQPLADIILKQENTSRTLAELAVPFLTESVSDATEAWRGARDIVAEKISENSDVRGIIREKANQWGSLQIQKIKKAKDTRGVYLDYYDFDQRLDRLKPHQILAINRGEAEKILRAKIHISERDWRFAINSQFKINHSSPLSTQLELAANDAADRLLLPAIQRDLRRSLTESAEIHAIRVFAENLRNLLYQPPLSGQTILGIDPGFRTGCKVAVIDTTGKVVDTATIYPHPPQKSTARAKEILKDLVEKNSVTLIAIGNGTASRETEQLIAELLKELGEQNLHYLIVSEAGASVYSASQLARKELPDLDVSMRGAVSIGRRVQDPLAEFVKIDPKSIGIGMYQHDVNQKELVKSLDAVVESVVNNVGVEINTASQALLTHVSGIGPKLAERIILYRNQHGIFKDRAALQNVPGLGPKAFEQSAGFLRISDGHNPFDNSAIHPESYNIAEQIIQRAGIELNSSFQEREAAIQTISTETTIKELAAKLNTGIPTLEDIFQQLIQPGRDPRYDLPSPILRSDVLNIEDLTQGMVLKGTVRNVVDFGAFIDIGVKQDGLLHRSKIPHGQRLGVGDVIDVKILNVEIDRGRISLGWM
jgi:uncharacterized protein